jgi:hypothetical protein
MSDPAPISALAPRAGGTGHADEFQLPLQGLFADMEMGRGSVQLPEEFRHSASLVQLQILRDWQRSLKRYRHEALCRFEQELSCGQPALAAHERIDLLRSTCATLRIDLPSEFGTVPAEP